MKFWQFVLTGLGGAVAVAVALYFMGQSKMATLNGEITDIRTLGVEKKASVAIVDFRAKNFSDVLFVAGNRNVVVLDEYGVRRRGKIISSFNLRQLFKYFPALGAASHEPYVEGIKLKPGQSVVGMLGARFSMSKIELDMRRAITLEIYDADGSLTELIR